MPNIFQEQITAEKPKSLAEERVYVYVPRATADTPGIASFDSTYFRLNAGKVYLRETDPTERPSMIMIKDKVEGLEEYTEDGHHYIRTYLKSINGDSLAGNTDLKLVTLDSIQTLDAQSLESGVSMKKILLSNSSDEAYGLQITKYGSTENVSIGSNRIEIYAGQLQRTTFSFGTIKTNDGNNEYTLTTPNKSGIIAVQSDIDRIDDALDTKVDISKTGGKNENGEFYFGLGKIENNGYNIVLTNNINAISTGGAAQHTVEVGYKGITLSRVYTDISQSTYYRNIELTTSGVALRCIKMGPLGITGLHELEVTSDGVYIDDVIIPKVASSYSNNAANAYNTTYINTMESNINDSITAITVKIPTQASSTNQLADKDFVNSSINNVAAFYITYNAAGDAFPTRADLINATVFYSGGEIRTPTRNDYAIVRADEAEDNATTRFSYQNSQWEFQYVVNETSMTAAQLAAINSGITDTLVAQITINENAIIALQSGKQNVLTAGANITISSDTISATDTTYSAGTGLTLVGTTFGVDTDIIQAKLTFDSVPTQGSTNPVTSGGVYSYIPNAMSADDIDTIMDAILV